MSFVDFEHIFAALKITARQRSLTVVKAFVTVEQSPYRHYLDIATTFINFNFFANSSKTMFAII